MTTSDGVRVALSWLATYGLHSTLFLGGAWLLCELRPPKINRNRERVWKLALVGGLLSTSLQLGLGAQPLFGRIEWHPAVAEETAFLRESAPEVLPELAQEVRSAKRVGSDAGETREEHWRDGTSHEEAARGGPRMSLAAEDGTTSPASQIAVSAPPESAPVEGRGEEAPDRKPRTTLAARPERVEPPEANARHAPDVRLEPLGSLEPGRIERLAQGLRRLSHSSSWPWLVLSGWTTIGLLGLAGFLASWTCLRRRMLGRELLRDGPLVEMLEELRVRARVSARVRLSVSPRIATPFSTGLLRPEVCLPAAVLTQLSRAQQEALLAHELAHLVRRDPAWFGISFLIEKLFFFQPLNRLARRQLAELAEVACDDWAVRWTGARVALASCLAEVAGWIIGERRHLHLAGSTPPGLAGHRSRLGQRVERLLDDRRSPASEPPAPWWPPLAAGALALVALAVPGVSATGIEQARAAQPAPETDRARPAPAPRPAPASAPEAHPVASEARARSAIAAERGVLESELVLLEAELAALHAELEARDLSSRFVEELSRIDARMDELRAQHQRVRDLLARLSTITPPTTPPNTPPTNTQASAPATPAEDPSPTAHTGESR